MIKQQHVSVIIPARDEESAIGQVIHELRSLTESHLDTPIIDHIIVCDNGSQDRTAQVAKCAGATVVHQPIPGYGVACLTALQALPPTDIILFMDGDHAFYAAQALPLLQAVCDGADLAIGSRTLGHQEYKALTFPQRVGNFLASQMIRALWKAPVTDLGPFRAISANALAQLNMQDERFGWTVEMQVKAIQLGMSIKECPVDTRRRIGNSKISGTLRGTIGAAQGIIGTIIYLWVQQIKQRHRTISSSVHSKEHIPARNSQ